MIVELIMNLLKFFLLFIIGLFPKLPDMSWLTGLITPVVSVIAKLDNFVDVGTLGLCVLVLLLFSGADLIWGVIMWVIRKIPGVS